MVKSFLWQIFSKFKFYIFLLLFAPIFSAINTIYQPYIMKLMIDSVNTITNPANVDNSNNFLQLKYLIFAYLGIISVENIAFRIYHYTKASLDPKMKTFIVSNLMEKMLNHSISLFSDSLSGNLANKIQDVRSKAPDLIELILLKFLDKFLSFAIGIYVVYQVNYKFSVLIFGLVVIIGVMIWYFNDKSYKLVIDSSRKKSIVVGRVVDIFVNISNVFLFASKRRELDSMKPMFTESEKADYKMTNLVNTIFSIQSIVFTTYLSLCMYFLYNQVLLQEITAGDFALIIGINMNLVGLIWDLSEEVYKLTFTFGEIRQGLEVAMQPIEIEDLGTKTLDQSKILGKIEFKDVNFQYKNTNRAIFENLSIKIEPKTTLGFVGHSGVGKSTLINLILRCFDIQSGQICIDDIDIKELKLDSLRSNISVIPQDCTLFHRTIFENIKYGRENATKEEVIVAAKNADAESFIQQLPQKYQTFVGERGVKLSGGQRSRIAIARAMLKNAPILILDEPTSNLDSITEQSIQMSLAKLMKDKTVIIIAHRLSTLIHLDRILVFENGKIVGDGTHNELLKTNKIYQKLWNTQINGFIQ